MASIEQQTNLIFTSSPVLRQDNTAQENNQVAKRRTQTNLQSHLHHFNNEKSGKWVENTERLAVIGY